MAEIIFILLFAVPAILGLAEIIHTIKLWIVSSGEGSKKLFVVVPDNEHFPRQIFGTCEEVKWQGNRLANKIIIIDTLLNEENKKECERLAQRLNFEICHCSEISALIIKEAE